MFQHLRRCAAGLLIVAAASSPVLAEESPISFASGPFAGAAAQDPKHEEETLYEVSGTRTTDTAIFRAGDMVAFVDWSRLSLDYLWADGAVLDSMASSVGRVFKARGVSTVRGDRRTVHGFSGQYRVVALKGRNDLCGVFVLKRVRNMISGFACSAGGQDVPIEAVMEGISIDHVIGP